MAQNKKHNVFLDSNIFIAAALSQTGGSFRIINESCQRNIALYANNFVIAEVARIMRKKFPERIDSAYELISSIPLNIEENPSAEEIADCDKTILNKCQLEPPMALSTPNSWAFSIVAV